LVAIQKFLTIIGNYKASEPHLIFTFLWSKASLLNKANKKSNILPRVRQVCLAVKIIGLAIIWLFALPKKIVETEFDLPDQLDDINA